MRRSCSTSVAPPPHPVPADAVRCARPQPRSREELQRELEDLVKSSRAALALQTGAGPASGPTTSSSLPTGAHSAPSTGGAASSSGGPRNGLVPALQQPVPAAPVPPPGRHSSGAATAPPARSAADARPAQLTAAAAAASKVSSGSNAGRSWVADAAGMACDFAPCSLLSLREDENEGTGAGSCVAQSARWLRRRRRALKQSWAVDLKVGLQGGLGTGSPRVAACFWKPLHAAACSQDPLRAAARSRDPEDAPMAYMHGLPARHAACTSPVGQQP
jgi:hypothetical protein